MFSAKSSNPAGGALYIDNCENLDFNLVRKATHPLDEDGCGMKNHDFEVEGPVSGGPMRDYYCILGTFLGEQYFLWDDGTLNKEAGSYTDLSLRGWFRTRSLAEHILRDAEKAGTLASVGEDALQKHAKGVCRRARKYAPKDRERFLKILEEMLK